VGLHFFAAIAAPELSLAQLGVGICQAVLWQEALQKQEKQEHKTRKQNKKTKKKTRKENKNPK